MKRLRPLFLILSALIMLAGAFVVGIWFGYDSGPEIDRIFNISAKTPDNGANLDQIDFGPFWKAWRLLEIEHVGDEKVSRQALVWGAIEGMVKAYGDPYTTFFPPKDLEDFQSEIKGEFSGIGAEIGIRKEQLVVIAPIKGSPAEQAGIRSGDKILKIDDTFTNDLSLDEAVHKIRGERGTKVKLTILRNGDDEPRVVEVTRDTIKIPNITAEQKSDGIYYIRLASFSEGSKSEFSDAVRSVLKSGSHKLILDLRGNPGGYFDAAVDIASWFLPEGEVVAQEVRRTGEPELYRSRGYRALEGVTTVILVDRGSASASEILAGALQENNKAILMGDKTFGKGSVQQLENITDDTSLKITIAKWLTPKGKSISKEGLTPDIEIKLPDDLAPGKDPQMDKAIEYLKTH